MKVVNKKQIKRSTVEKQDFRNFSETDTRHHKAEEATSVISSVYFPSVGVGGFVFLISFLILVSFLKNKIGAVFGISLFLSASVAGVVFYFLYRSWKTQNQRVFMKQEMAEDRPDDSHLTTTEELFLLNDTNFFPDFATRYDVEKTGYPKGMLSHVFLNNDGINEVEISNEELEKIL